jgi:hypothetical protein
VKLKRNTWKRDNRVAEDEVQDLQEHLYQIKISEIYRLQDIEEVEDLSLPC